MNVKATILPSRAYEVPMSGERCDSGSLQRIACRFACLRGSSANIERIFSALKYVQGSWRMNLNTETMRDMVRLRLKEDSGLTDLIAGFENGVCLEDEDAATQEVESTPVAQEIQYPAQRADLPADREMEQLYDQQNRIFDFMQPARPINELHPTSEDLSIEELLKEYRSNK